MIKIGTWLKSPWERAWNKKSKESQWPTAKEGESPTEYLRSLGLEAKAATNEASVYILKEGSLVAKLDGMTLSTAKSYKEVTDAIKEALDRATI